MNNLINQLEEHFDCYLELGATLEHLRMLTLQEIGSTLERWETNKEDANWVLKIHIPNITTLYEWLRELDLAIASQAAEKAKEEAGEDEEETTVEMLVSDYELTVGVLAEEATPLLNPLDYMDEYLIAVGMPPREVCRQFLEIFFSPGVVEEWIEQYAWDEDEDDTGPGDPS